MVTTTPCFTTPPKVVLRAVDQRVAATLRAPARPRARLEGALVPVQDLARRREARRLVMCRHCRGGLQTGKTSARWLLAASCVEAI